MRLCIRPYARTKEGGNNMAFDRTGPCTGDGGQLRPDGRAYPGRRPGGDRPAAPSPSRWRRQGEYVRPAPPGPYGRGRARGESVSVGGVVMNTSIDRQIEVYEGMAESLEAKHLARWVVIHGEQFIGAFDRIEDAGRVASCRFGKEPLPAPAGGRTAGQAARIRALQAPARRRPGSICTRTPLIGRRSEKYSPTGRCRSGCGCERRLKWKPVWTPYLVVRGR